MRRSRKKRLTPSQKLDANEKREQQFNWAGRRCVVCGRKLEDGHQQLAHRVINSKNNDETLPDEILHHPLNTIPVDNSGRCNSRVILNWAAAAEHLARIKRVLAGEETVDYREEYTRLREEFMGVKQ
jgi:hypothetical protein